MDKGILPLKEIVWKIYLPFKYSLLHQQITMSLFWYRKKITRNIFALQINYLLFSVLSQLLESALFHNRLVHGHIYTCIMNVKVLITYITKGGLIEHAFHERVMDLLMHIAHKDGWFGICKTHLILIVISTS